MKRKIQFLLVLLIFVFVTACNTKPTISDEKLAKFWIETKNELDKIPLTSERIAESEHRNKRIQLYRINSFNNVSFYAWVFEPLKEGLYNTKVFYSGYGRGNTNIDSFPKESFMMEENTICMKVDIRGQGLSTDTIRFDGFLSNGNESKETYVYRGAYMDAVRAIDFIASNQKSNGKILTIGGSQGGLLSLVASALNPKADCCIANYPFFSDVNDYKSYDWPFFAVARGISNNKAARILAHYDAIIFARMIDVPVFMSCAKYDDKTPVAGINRVYDSIRVKDKQFYIAPCEGHGCSSRSTFISIKQMEFVDYFFD